MRCPACRHDNPATLSYCRQCGGRLDLTADEISESLLEKAKGAVAKDTAYLARNILVAAVVLFLIALTLFVFSGGAPEEGYHVPAGSLGAKSMEYRYPIEKELKPLEIPEEK